MVQQRVLTDNIPPDLRERPQWVVWSWETRKNKDGREVKTKPPRQPNGSFAKTNDPSTWTTFDTAVDCMPGVDGIGYVFAKGDGLVGVDLDKCRNPFTKELADWAKEIVDAFDHTYTETSPSGTGVKLICKGRAVQTGSHKWKNELGQEVGIEVYDLTSPRYFCVTGDALTDHIDLQERQLALDWLHGKYFATTHKEQAQARTANGDIDFEQVRKALACIPSDEYRLWLEIGMALKSSGLPFEVWEDWSRNSTKFEDGQCQKKWASFRGSGVGLGSLFHAAKLHGFTFSKSSRTVRVHSESTEPSDETDKKKPKQADLLIECAADCELWRDSEDAYYATFSVNGHREHGAIRSRRFKGFLNARYYERFQSAPSAQATEDALRTLEAKAHHEGQTDVAALRIAGHSGSIYLDLCNEAWECVLISTDGWDIVGSNDCPVRFVRNRGMLPLPTPITPQPNTLSLIKALLNISDEEIWRLFLAGLIGILNPEGPYPVIAITGEQGSGKSTVACVIRAITDPHLATTRRMPDSEQDLFIAAKNGHLLSFDNISGIPGPIADAICTIATGGGFAKRELYSNADEAMIYAQNPFVLNGITEFLSRPDLVDRAMKLSLPTIPEDRRISKKEFWERFDKLAPAFLGALVSAMSSGLKNLPSVCLKKAPRMIDFAQWACACAPALGFSPDEFLNNFMNNQEEALRDTLDASPLVRILLRLSIPWRGTPDHLFKTLADEATEAEKRGLPKSASRLSGELIRLAPALRKIGIHVEKAKSNGRRFIEIEKRSQEKNDLPREGSVGRDGRDGTGTQQNESADPVESANQLELSGIRDGRDGTYSSYSKEEEREIDWEAADYEFQEGSL